MPNIPYITRTLNIDRRMVFEKYSVTNQLEEAQKFNIYLLITIFILSYNKREFYSDRLAHCVLLVGTIEKRLFIAIPQEGAC